MPVDKMTQSTYLGDIVHVKHKDVPLFLRFTLISISGPG